VGGDLYPYYMPQKVYLAESLRVGIIPFWNSLVGFGYPVLGESQTGALYPPNLILFSTFAVNTAYNMSQLGHYLLAFCGTYFLARRWGLQTGGSLLAATAFVYGWFPARICLEWAIIGGAWFVWILWAATAYLQTSRRSYLLILSLFLGLDLLAGHYNLAFITLLTLIPFPWLVPLRQQTPRPNVHENETRSGWRRSILLWIAVIGGFLLAAVQLIPTWELKTLSQRQDVNKIFAPTYGHLPIQALSQLWMPWAWSAGNGTMDERLAACQWLRVPNATNQVEAQLYVGLLTLMLALLALLHPQFRRGHGFRSPWGWSLLAIGALIMATGWPMELFPWLPGLNFFRGPGRYSITAALAISLLGGAGLDAVLQRMDGKFKSRFVLTGALLLLTMADLWTASRQYNFGIAPYLGRKVFYAVMLDGPPLKFRDESPLRRYFAEALLPVRIYAPGANLPTLLGVSALPVYLGLGPEIYESEIMKFDFDAVDDSVIKEECERLRKFGVTHLLLETALPPGKWPVIARGEWADRMLQVALGKQTPFFLYELEDSPGRISLVDTSTGQLLSNQIRHVILEPQRVRIDVDCTRDCTLVLRDLDYPGWRLQSPHQAAVPIDGLFRGVHLTPQTSGNSQQTVEWVYRPRSIFLGMTISLLGLAAWIAGVVWKGRE